MFESEASVVFRPGNPELAFLPEGPQNYGPNLLSWVAIQHGADSNVGSLNILNLDTGENRNFPLPGRPGFAFPSGDPDVFTIGMERKIGRFNIASGEWIDGDLVEEEEGTIINDGEPCGEAVIFGTKDLEFASPKAGLYFWHPERGAPTLLRGGQICSNGKVVITREDGPLLLDIDSPAKTVVAYPLDLESVALGEPRMVLDLRDGDAFPDGMVSSPDGESIIIAFYNPNEVAAGEARIYRLPDGELQGVWKTPGSPRVTCPQLTTVAGETKLVLTTAVEHMTGEEQARHANAGCLFMAETPF